MDDATLQDALERLGLTDAQAKAYRTILDYGDIRVSELATETGLSRSGTYKVIDALAERELVVVNNYLTPTTVRPTTSERIIDEFGGLLDDVAAGVAERTSPASTAQPLEYLRSAGAVRDRVQRLLDGARDEVFVGLDPEHLPLFEESLRDAVDRGVLVVLFFSESPENVLTDMAPLTELAHVARVGDWTGHFRLVAGSDAVLLADKSAVFHEQNQAGAILSTERHVVFEVRSVLLGPRWEGATELCHRDPGSLPRTYHSFRHATLDTTLHRQAGTELAIQAEAVGVDHGERATIEGRVTGTRQCLVDPLSNRSRMEVTIEVNTDEGIVDLGGVYASDEHYAIRLPVHLEQA